LDFIIFVRFFILFKCVTGTGTSFLIPIYVWNWICKVMKFYYISAFNAQSSTLIIVVVQVGAVKIYVTTVEALRKKER
jgi:hypothetical protein